MIQIAIDHEYVTLIGDFDEAMKRLEHAGIEVDPRDWPRYEKGRRCKAERLNDIDQILMKVVFTS